MTIVYILAGLVSLVFIIGDYLTTVRGLALGAREGNPLVPKIASVIGLRGTLIAAKGLAGAVALGLALWLVSQNEAWYWIAGALATPAPLHAFAVWNNLRVIKRLKA